MLTLENWFLVIDNPYSPPEISIPSLKGDVYGHESFEDGSHIQTSRVVDIKKRMVTTISGSEYTLGEPDEDYVKWCEDSNIHVPTEEEPIKWKNE
jgi:hypothetical protein